MAVAYKGAGNGSGTETNNAQLALVCPATVAQNDILIAHVIYLNNSTQPTTPEDWTRLYTSSGLGAGLGTGTPTGRAYVYGKLAVGNEDGATINFGTAGGTAGRYGRIYSFSGYVSGTITDVVPSDSFADTPSETDPSAPDITTTVTGSLAVALVAQDDNNSIGSFTGESGGNWTEAVAEYTSSTIGSQGCMCQLQTATPTANPGTITGGTYNTSNDENSTIVFEIRPNIPNTAPTVELNSPADEDETYDTTPDLEFTGTDLEDDDVTYEVQIDTVNTFDSVGEEVLIASQETTYVATTFDSNQKFVGQSFTGTTGTLSKYVSKLRTASGTPTGNLVARLYSHTGTYGTSSCGSTLLATSDNVDVSTLSSSATDINFNFSGSERYSLVGGTYYVIGVFYEAVGGTIQTYVANGDVCTGNYCSINSLYNWNYSSSQDIYFKVYTANKTPLIDKISTTDAGFSGDPDSTDPFASAQAVTYTIQSALDPDTYYWRVRGKDPDGTNTFGDWSDVQSFVILSGTKVYDDRNAKISGIATTTNARSAKITGKATANDYRSAKLTGGVTTNNARSAKLSGIQTLTNDRSAKITGNATATTDRDAKLSGIQTLTNDRSAKVTGKVLTNDYREAKLTGKVTTNDYRSAKITGKETAFSTRNAKISGKTTAYNARTAIITGGVVFDTQRSAYLKGKDTSNDNRSAKVTGSALTNDYRNAKLTGYATATNDREAKVTGFDTTNDNRSAKIIGKETANDYRSATLKGIETLSNIRNARLVGCDTSDTSRGAVITGIDTDNDYRNAKIIGQATADSSRSAKLTGEPAGVLVDDARSAKITGKAGANDYRNAKLTGKATSNDYRLAKVVGNATLEDTRQAVITGVDTDNSSRNAHIVGKVNTLDDRTAVITGKDTGTDNRIAKITGYDTAQDTRSAKLHGTATGQDNRNATITGIDTANSSRGAKIHGIVTITDFIYAKIHGKDTSVAYRLAKLMGKALGTSYRSAKLHGIAVGTAIRNAVITGKDTANSNRNARITGNQSTSSSRGALIVGKGIWYQEDPKPFKTRVDETFATKDTDGWYDRDNKNVGTKESKDWYKHLDV